MTVYYSPQYFSTTLNVGGGIDSSQTTGITLQSVSGLDITKPGIACLSYTDPIVTSTAEWVTYTSINGSNVLQGVTRGAEGYSAKAHSNGATIAFPISKSHINNVNDLLTGVTGGIALKSPVVEVATTSGTQPTYVLTPSPAITAYATGQEFTILIHSANTGAATINISGLGAKAITKNGATALSSGDLALNGEYKIVYDGTQFQVMGVSSSGSGGLTNFLTQYSAGNLIVGPDLMAHKTVQESITLATVKIYLKDGPNTGATATFIPKRNTQKLFSTAPTIAAPTQQDALNATTGWSGTGVTFATEATIKKEGTNSMKMTIDGTGNRTATKTFSSFSAASPKAITFWIGATAAQTCKFFISDGTNTSYFDIDNVPLVSSSNLNFARVYLTSEKLNNPDSNSGTKATITTITSMGWSSLVASAVYYVDDIELENYYTGTPTTTALVAGDTLNVDCTVIGSTLAGAGLEVEWIKV